MGEMLDAIGSQLSIRYKNEEGRYIYKDVPEKTRTRFKEVFNQDMYRKLSKMKVGDTLDYMFDCGTTRPLSMLMDDANQDLAEVLQKMPHLPEGESYAFPQNSYIEIILTGKSGKRMHIKLKLVSDVFVKAGL